MRVAFIKRSPGAIEFGIVYGGIVLLGIFAGRFLPVLDFAPSCTFKALTGFPCPTCGATRSIVFLSHGNLISSFFMNPLIFAVAVMTMLYLFYSLFVLVFDIKKISIAISGQEKDRIRLTAIALILINWFYLIITL